MSLQPVPISALPSAVSVEDGDYIPIVQEGITKKATRNLVNPTVDLSNYARTDVGQSFTGINTFAGLIDSTVADKELVFSVNGRYTGSAQITTDGNNLRIGAATTYNSVALELNKNSSASGMLVMNNDAASFAYLDVANGNGSGSYGTGLFSLRQIGNSATTSGMQVQGTSVILASGCALNAGTFSSFDFTLWANNAKAVKIAASDLSTTFYGNVSLNITSSPANFVVNNNDQTALSYIDIINGTGAGNLSIRQIGNSKTTSGMQLIGSSVILAVDCALGVGTFGSFDFTLYAHNAAAINLSGSTGNTTFLTNLLFSGSTNQGLVVNRLTTTQIGALSSVTNGAIVYDTILDVLQTYQAGAWVNVVSAGGGGTVTSVSIATANGVSGTSSGGSTPSLTISLGAITPTSVNSVVLSGSSTPTLAVTGTSSISGANTGDQTSVSGNAGTATKLATARNINSVLFDGSADITVAAAAGTLTGTTLKSTVVTSSLTSVGALTSGSLASGFTAVTAPLGGTGQTSYTVGDILYASTTTALSKLTAGAAGTLLMYNGTGTAPQVSTTIWPNALTANQILYGTSTNTVGSLNLFNYNGTSLGVGIITPITTATAMFYNNQNAATVLYIANPNTTTSGNAAAALILGISATDYTTNYGLLEFRGTNAIASGVLKGLTTLLEGKGSNMVISNLSATENIVFCTGSSRASRMTISGSAGDVAISSSTASTSSTTGSFTVAGGAGIVGDLNIGGIVNAYGAGFFGINNSGAVYFSVSGSVAGSNAAGSSIHMQAGLPNGNATGTVIDFATSNPTSSGVTQQTMSIRMAIDYTAISITSVDLKLNTAGKGIFIKSGSNCKMDTGTLVGGTATISNSTITSTSFVFCFDTGGNALTNVGSLTEDKTARVPGTSFKINSTNPLDTSTFNYFIFETT